MQVQYGYAQLQPEKIVHVVPATRESILAILGWTALALLLKAAKVVVGVSVMLAAVAAVWLVDPAAARVIAPLIGAVSGVLIAMAVAS